MIPRLTLLAACAASLAAPAARASSLPFDFAPTANVQYDGADTDSDVVPDSGEQGFRRARLGFRLKDPGKRWQFVAEHDFSDRTAPDAYLELTPADGHAVRIGQFKQPFSLEDAISDKETAFLETSTVGAFVINRRIGAEYARFGRLGTLNAAVFGKRLDGTNHSTGAALRGTWLLRNDTSAIAHVGMSLATESPETGRASFSANPGTVFTDVRLASTGGITSADRIDRAALEGLWIHGAWSAQAEHARVRVARDAHPDFDGTASTAQLTWSPSGDGRTYKRGVIKSPAPAHGLAWELALRWSTIDLDDDGIAGGRAHSVGLAANCYAGPHVRIGANVVHSSSQRRGVEDQPDVFVVRVQLIY